MTDSLIDYDAKVQEALRYVVKSVLTETAKDGMKGDHHFYIAFKTNFEGVDIPDHLIERFPDEMTIVLQHKFWGLKVEDTYFEVGLSFNHNPELLVIPFEAIVGFVDPSVQFALQFPDEDLEENLQDLGDTTDDSPALETSPVVAENESPMLILKDGDSQGQPKTVSDQNTDNVVTLDTFRKK